MASITIDKMCDQMNDLLRGIMYILVWCLCGRTWTLGTVIWSALDLSIVTHRTLIALITCCVVLTVLQGKK